MTLSAGYNALIDRYLLAAVASGLVPGYEPRYACILLCMLLGPFKALMVSLAEAAALSITLALTMEKAWLLLCKISERSNIVKSLLSRVESARDRAKSLIDRYGLLGLMVFVAIPLPLTGIYTGSIVAILLGLSKTKSITALFLGGAASIAIVAVLAALGEHIVA